MYVLSADKDALINLDTSPRGIVWYPVDRNGNGIIDFEDDEIFGYEISANCMELGVYKTKEEVVAIFEKLAAKLDGGRKSASEKYVNIFEMPKNSASIDDLG